MPHTSPCKTGNDFVTFFRYICLTSQKSFQSIVSKAKTIMKKILLLAALLIGSVSATWAADHRVTVSDFVFTPSTVNAVAGDTVTWIWRTGMHTTTSTSIPPGARSWNAPIDSVNTRFRIRLRVAGTYNYQCNFHFAQGMVGTIVVSAASPRQAPATN
jgi:plastocyanin